MRKSSRELMNYWIESDMLSNSEKNELKNVSDNETEIPQTGIEDYNVGILLIICVASAIFAYKKINDYKNV